MLVVTKEDIKQLNDADLRDLIGLLCEAELYSINNKTSDVMYGGHQDEPDGGVDVLVKATKIKDDESYILRNNTIFQVKKYSMSQKKIQEEMLYKENIKECIASLDKTKGAYIIVSSGDSLTQITYRRRIVAMNDILKKHNLKNVKVEFYDSNRIATWVRNYPSLICWINDKLKKQTNGWTSYCNWSSRSTEETDFLVDDNCTIYKNNITNDSKIKIVDCINDIRNKLLVEGSSIRLAGLSGVGKTRFAQALFDDKIGENALNKEMVIYGDVSDSLSPEPICFLQQLQKLNRKIILIVDNCEPTMHNKLTEICQRTSSKISIMTIEYDVKEDDNISSSNYYLGPTTKEVLKKLLKSEYKNISDINVETIVNCSDGNFRIAIYLAKSINNEKNIGILKYGELFNRLFNQGDSIDKEQLKIGEICSLFYSFDISYDLQDEKNELNIISRLSSINNLDVLKKVEELRAKQIIQKRGNMRALLPHALANKLAIDCFKSYPMIELYKLIDTNQRLSLSFFRRMKYLHLSEEAQQFAQSFIDSLDSEDFINFNGNMIEKIKCIAIMNQEIVLSKLEDIKDDIFFSRENKNFYEWTSILYIIAYEKDLFSRAIKLMIRFALTERVEENYNSIRHTLYGFFHIYLSYTHAAIETRLNIIDTLIHSKEQNKINLGIKLLEEALSTGSFVGVPIYECGSQIRDYGLEPSINEWYPVILNYCENLLKKKICYDEVKNMIINNFRDLVDLGYYNELEKIVLDNLNDNKWCTLWISLLSIKHFDGDNISKDLMKKIDNLIEKVRPSTLKEKIETYLCKGNKIYFNLDDTTDDYESIDELIYNLGKEVGKAKSTLMENLLLLDDTCDFFRISVFARGIYEEINNVEELIKNILKLHNEKNKNVIKNLVSYLILIYHNNDSKACSKYLSEITESNEYSSYYTFMQLSYKMSEEDAKKLIQQIDLNKVNVKDLYKIEFCIGELAPDILVQLLEKLTLLSGMNNAVFNCLFRYCQKNKINRNFKLYIRTKIADIDYIYFKSNKVEYENYIVSKLITYSFDKDDGNKEATTIFNKVNKLLDKESLLFRNYEKILLPLIKLYPVLFLNTFIDYKGQPNWNKSRFLMRYYNNRNVLLNINDDIVIDWIKCNSKIVEISYVLEPFNLDKSNESYSWTKLGKYVIENYYDKEEVIKNLLANIFPSSWSNEYSTVLKKRENLFIELEKNENVIISNIGKQNHIQLLKEIDYYLKKEKEDNEKRFNTFE